MKIADNVPDENETGSTDKVQCVGFLSESGLAALVKRVEFMVGTQVWQTLEGNDILAAQRTELSDGAFAQASLQQRGSVTERGTRLGPLNGVEGQIYRGETYSCSLKLPLLSKTLGPKFTKFSQNTEDGYLMAAAPHQQVKIRVYYSNAQDVFSTRTALFPQYFSTGAGINYTGDADTMVGNELAKTIPYGITLKTQLFGKQQVMCNAERQQLKNMPQGLPKRIKMTQNTVKTVSSPDKLFTVDLDHFSLYASYLVINISGLQVVSEDSSATGDPEDNNQRQGSLLTAELLLNSTSISGVLPGEFLSSSAANSLAINNSRSHINSNQGQLTHFVFPLASHAYDGSAIPLNRFDNIRLNLVCTSPAETQADGVVVSVTCFGETTALYRGGAASLAMY